MQRLLAAIRDFFNSFAWIEEAHGRFGGMLKTAWILLLALAGPTAFIATANSWAPSLEPFSVYLLTFSVGFIAWRFGQSWERTKGPLIWISSPEYDQYYGFIELCVKNIGSGSVKAKAFVQNMKDQKGHRIPRINDHFELHWRGKHLGETMELFGAKPGHVAVLRFNREDVGSPQFVGPALVDFGVTPVFTPSMQNLKNEPITFEVRVDFFGDDGQLKATATRRFGMTPDAKGRWSHRIQKR